MITLKTIPHFFRSAQTKGIFKYVLLTSLLCLSINAYSSYTVVGCVSDDTGYLYTNSSGVYSAHGYWYGPAYETTPVVTSGQLGWGMYCGAVDLGNCVIRSKSNCRECTGPYDYRSGWGTDYYYEQAGQLTGYVMCPIDDYAGFLFLAIGGAGFYFLRRRKALMLN